MKELTGIQNRTNKILSAGKLAGFGIVLGMLLFVVLPVSCVRAEEKMTLFVSTGCPHCIKVSDFIVESGIEDKIMILNVHTDDGAAEKYTDFTAEHEIPLNEQGTPTLIYDEDNWVVGDTPIIDFLAERYELSDTNGASGNTDDDISDDDSPDFTVGDYVIFGIGMVVVLSFVGYGIVSLDNGWGKS